MAGNDNILQAPASGFGQDVSFSSRPGNPVVLDGTGRGGHTRGGVTGSPGGSISIDTHRIDAPPNATLALLTKAGGELLAPRIKQAKAQAFVSGMQRAAGGEAILDIAEGEPWYTRIFGESDVVEGARQYTAQAKAAGAAAAIEDSMGEARKLDPDQAQAYYSDLVSQYLTGDDVADAAIMQGFARTLPPTMRRQAKEHYAYRQEEASKAESSAVMALADLAQKRAGSDKQTDDEYATQAVQLIAAMKPAQGRDMESWTKARTSDLLALAQGGKFHAVNAMREAGMLTMLDPAQRTRIESALDTAENKVIANKSFEYATLIGQIAGQAEVYHDELSAKDTYAQMASLNERFRKETGIDRDLISLDKGTGVIKSVHETLLREGQRAMREGEAAAEKARGAGDKAAEKAALALHADRLIALGQAGEGKAGDSTVGKLVDQQFLAHWRAAAHDPAKQAQMLASNWRAGNGKLGYVNADIKDYFERGLDSAVGQQMPVQFKELSLAYEAMHAADPAAADSYFGKYAERMGEYHRTLVKTGPDGKPLPWGSRNEELGFARAFAAEPLRPKKLDKDGLKAQGKALRDLASGPAWHGLSHDDAKLRDDQFEQVQAALAPRTARYVALSGGDMEQATKRAWAELQRETGAEMIGGFLVSGHPNQPPLLNVLRRLRDVGSDSKGYWGKALTGVFAERAQRMGFDADTPVQISRYDRNGGTYLQTLFIPRDGGMPVRDVISLDDLKAHAFKADATKATAKAAVRESQSRDNPDYGSLLAGQ